MYCGSVTIAVIADVRKSLIRRDEISGQPGGLRGVYTRIR